MEKIISITLLFCIAVFYSCKPDQPTAPKLDILKNDITLVAVGNSLTAGFQSSGLAIEFQLNSYPNLIAQQMKNTKFEQPLIKDPGIGSPSGMTPMYLDNEGNIVQDALDPVFVENPQLMLLNAILSRPYDNLGVPGADLNDLLNTIDASGGNPFFSLVLRNPNLFNTTMLEQAALLQPTILLLWAGNNDVLGAALDGGVDNGQITAQGDFDSRMTSILDQLENDIPNTTIIMANIPDVTDIPYVNILDGIIVSGVPMVFDAQLQVIDFGAGTNIPLITTEQNVEHITLVGLLAYQQGLGIPDSTFMVDVLSIPPAQASLIQAGLIDGGLTPTGQPLDNTMTLTNEETTAITNAVTGFNQNIATQAQSRQIPLVDANARLSELNSTGLEGASGKFVLVDRKTTAFSLDGVHANNAGYAIIANAFIEKINEALSLEPPIPSVDVSEKLGQYDSAPPKLRVSKAVNNVKEIFHYGD